MPKNEWDLKDDVHGRLKACRALGLPLWFLKIHGSRWQRSGVMDYLVVYDGKPYAPELKRPGEKASALQAAEMRDFHAAGGTTGLCYSWHDVCQLLGLPDVCYTIKKLR